MEGGRQFVATLHSEFPMAPYESCAKWTIGIV
jgi:hypothetical protein